MEAPETDGRTRAQLARSWDVLEERLRILRGKLKPGSINTNRSEEPVKKPRSRSLRDVVRVMRENTTEPGSVAQ
jgi:hypothetical protein